MENLKIQPGLVEAAAVVDNDDLKPSARRRLDALAIAIGAGLLGLLAFSACSSDSSPGSAATADAGQQAANADAGRPTSPEAGETGDGAGPKTTRPAANTLMLPTTMEYPAEKPWFNIYRPVDLNATGQPLPVIVWANGGCYRSDFTWAPLFDRWAAGGFVVLALTADPDAGAMVMSNIGDQAGLVDWTIAKAAAAGSPYAGKLDTHRIVAAGNSCGGVTALGLAAQDPRIAAVFVLSGSSGFGSANKSVIDKILVPDGYVVGGSQDIARANAISDYDALAPSIPAMIVSRFEGDHVTVSTDKGILTEEAEIALNWMDLALYGTHGAYDELTSATVCSGCDAGTYTLMSKNLEKLLK
jgi:predicted dienelactone hydrolase